MADNRIEWYRTPLEPGDLKALTRQNNAPGLVQAGSFLLIYLCTLGLSLAFYLQKLWVPMVIACYVHSLFLFFMSMAAAVHELSHGTAIKNKALNDFFYNLFCFLTWNNPVHFRVSHMLHHQNTVHRGIDLEVLQGPVRDKLNFWTLLAQFTFDIPWFLHFMRVAFLHAFGQTDADYFAWKPLMPKEDPRRRSMIAWARFMILAHLVLALVFAYFHLWVLIYLVTFGSFFATILGKSCGALQHTGLSESVPDWRVTCHTFLFGPVMRYLYWNMNFHIEHHMFAAVPFHRLPRLHALVEKDYPISRLGFFGGLGLLSQIKAEQRKNPSYIHIPAFPGTAAPVKWK